MTFTYDFNDGKEPIITDHLDSNLIDQMWDRADEFNGVVCISNQPHNICTLYIQLPYGD